MKKQIVVLLVFVFLMPIETLFLKASPKTESSIALKEDTAPQAQEMEGAKKKKSVIGKIAMWTLHVAAIGGLAWYFFINPDSPLKKKEEPVTPEPVEKGDYTSVTLRFTIKCKGFNVGRNPFSTSNSSNIACYIDQKKVDDLATTDYDLFDLPGPNSDCSNAIVIIDKTKDVVITQKKLIVSYVWAGWQINPNFKALLCPEFSVIPISYTYESGKADPGMPVILGLEDLIIKDGTVNGGLRVHVAYSTPEVSLFIVKPDQV